MSQELKSGLDNTLATVDPTSKALRVTQYKTNGSLLYDESIGEYMVSATILTTASLATTVGLFHIRNGSIYRVKLKSIIITLSNAGTAGATVFAVGIDRYNSASTTPSGATAITFFPPENSTMPASTVAACMVATAGVGLTLTGLTKTGLMHSCSIPRSVTSTTQTFSFEKDIELNFSEGLIIYPLTATVIGDAFSISLYWEELV